MTAKTLMKIFLQLFPEKEDQITKFKSLDDRTIMIYFGAKGYKFHAPKGKRTFRLEGML